MFDTERQFLYRTYIQQHCFLTFFDVVDSYNQIEVVIGCFYCRYMVVLLLLLALLLFLLLWQSLNSFLSA